MSCILSLVGGPAQRVQVLDWIFADNADDNGDYDFFYGDDDNDDDDNTKAK